MRKVVLILVLAFFFCLCNNEGNTLSANKYNTPPEVDNLYYKDKNGTSVVKLRIWSINYSSGDPNLDNYMRNAFGEGAKWGAELSPGLLASNKFEIKDDYFIFKRIVNGRIIEYIKVARDLSWVSGYSQFGGSVEFIYDRKATKQEYEKSYQTWKKAAQIMQSGGPHPSFSNTSPKNNKLKLEKLPNKHGYTTCKGCGGNGKCHICGGTGKQSTSEYDAVLGRSINTLTDCGICHGTGNCGVCFGMGKISY